MKANAAAKLRTCSRANESAAWDSRISVLRTGAASASSGKYSRAKSERVARSDALALLEGTVALRMILACE
jgi:hypothetical protein